MAITQNTTALTQLLAKVQALPDAPSGNINITTNGVHDVASKQTATVNVPQGEDCDATASDLRSGKTAMVNGTIITGNIPTKTDSDLTATGSYVSVPKGIYDANCMKSVASGTAGTPVATKEAVTNHQISIIPSVTNTTGYITGSTKTGSMVTVTASELVSGKLDITDTAVKDVTNYSQAQIVDANLTAENIAKNVTVLGITGTHSGGVPEHGVFFIDYDGTLIEAWASEDVASKTALPNNPTGHTRLVAQGWNWSLADIKAYILADPTANVYVGQIYATASGMTELDITITTITGKTVTCNISGTKDWGDGTTNTSSSHTYAAYGNYTIKCSGTTISGNIFGTTSSNVNRYWCTAAYIASGVTRLDTFAFEYCYSLISVTIPNGITYLATLAFRDCPSLISVTVPHGVTLGGYVFNNCYSLTSVAIPNNLKSIKVNMFNGCFNLTGITIPNSVTSIEGGAFSGCYSLTSVAILGSVTSVDTYAFSSCSALTSVKMLGSVTSIGGNMFDRCYSLTSVTMPSSVTSIGSSAFSSCHSIIKYDFSSVTAVPTLVNTNAFTNINGLCKIVVPDALYDSWKAETNWSTYADYIYKASEVTD